MSYSVTCVLKSVAPHGATLTTIQARYPRMIHAEFMTHRAISRNASSTRAIPMPKQIQAVIDDPFIPIYWGKNQRGMQATEELSEDQIGHARGQWLAARDDAVNSAKALVDYGIHKQLAGRIIEPFSHISIVATATDEGWANFFSLRCDKNAMPEIQKLAVMMARAYHEATPQQVGWGEYHLPYLTDDEKARVNKDTLDDWKAISVARCARVSYLTHDGTPAKPEADIALHDTLASNGHWSPFEHVGTPAQNRRVRSGNFVGWDQYRQELNVSVHNTFDFGRLEQFKDRDFIT